MHAIVPYSLFLLLLDQDSKSLVHGRELRYGGLNILHGGRTRCEILLTRLILSATKKPQ
jgi:hypothetical protein